MGWALECVISTYGMDLLDPAIAINIRQLTSFIVYSIIIMPWIGGYSIALDSLTIHNSGYLILGTALVGSISYLFWYKSMSMTGAGRAMALNITYALWGIIFGFLLTDTIITEQLILGASVITLGALLVIANPKELMNLRG
jgi:drug/metabolite transporter (DMT)-like permease